jgi:hypothetical protein
MSIKFPLSDAEVLAIVDNDGDDLGDSYADLYTYYTESGEMPYGTAKARDGDPDQWIFAQLEQRARAIRFFTDTSHPSVGDGDRVHRAVALFSRGRDHPAELLMGDARVITEHDLDDGTGVGLLPAFHDENEDRAPLGKEYQTSAAWAADAKTKGLDPKVIDYVERTTEALSGFTVHDVGQRGGGVHKLSSVSDSKLRDLDLSEWRDIFKGDDK